MMMNAATLVIGCDHAAFQLKETLKAYLKNNGYAVDDVGAFSVASVDYPEIGATLASQISAGTYRRGILICGTGLGMSMVANKYPHVRAALCNDLFSAAMSRRHNDANILVMGGPGNRRHPGAGNPENLVGNPLRGGAASAPPGDI
jgi:ribose 5-phosphate isomerase B